MSYRSSARIVECVSEYIFLISKKKKKKKKKTKITRRQKVKETKEEKKISVKNLTRYNNFVCEFALCTFNLFDRVLNFSWLFMNLM